MYEALENLAAKLFQVIISCLLEGHRPEIMGKKRRTASPQSYFHISSSKVPLLLIIIECKFDLVL